MCGRFVQARDLDDYLEYYSIDAARLDEEVTPSYNVAPTDPILTVAEHDGRRLLGRLRWGLIPHYAKNRRTIHINARLESITDKPAFRSSFAKRRCLIPADGFYEWELLQDGSKQPHFIQLAGMPMALAGIWTRWTDPETGEKLRTCAIITTDADPQIAAVHDRMPVSLQPDLWDDWLDPDLVEPDALRGLLDANRPGGFVDTSVSTMVNSVRNNSPELLVPV
ncbi:MAG: SOS response-associated peptidase [Acidimicrobiia bacterium]|nr:SOS response-associated peptidase [Acidimicrobiia bacterium]